MRTERTLRKIKTFLIASLCILLIACCFIGCTAGSKTANETKLQSDLLKSEGISYYGITDISELEIEKRQTSVEDKEDIVYVNVVATSEEKAIQLMGSYTMVYGLYNDGWILDDLEIRNLNVQPLAGTDYTNEELEAALNLNGYTGIFNLSVKDHVTDLSTGTDTYSLTFDEVHTYVTFRRDADLSFIFDSRFGQWNPYDSFVTELETDENWHIAGEYGWYNYNGEITNTHITIFDNSPVEALSVRFTDQYSDRVDDETCEGLYDAQLLDLQTFAAEVFRGWGRSNSYYSISYRYTCITDYGFSVKISKDYSSLAPFSCATFCNDSGNASDAIFFIGPDDLAICRELDVVLDEYTRRVILQLNELIPQV